MNIQTLNTIEAQRQLATLVSTVSQDNAQVRITGQVNAEARLVSERFIAAVEQILSEDSALADTLALLMNGEALRAIERSREDVAQGNKIPFDNREE